MAELSAYGLARRAFLKEICPDRRCHHCKRKAPSWKALEVDHLDGKGWIASKVNSWQRLRLMQREVAANLAVGIVGRLVGSCGHCNKSTSSRKRYRWQVRKRRNGGGKGYSSWAVGYTAHLAAQLAAIEHTEQLTERDAGEDGDRDPAGGILVDGHPTAHVVTDAGDQDGRALP